MLTSNGCKQAMLHLQTRPQLCEHPHAQDASQDATLPCDLHAPAIDWSLVVSDAALGFAQQPQEHPAEPMKVHAHPCFALQAWLLKHGLLICGESSRCSLSLQSLDMFAKVHAHQHTGLYLRLLRQDQQKGAMTKLQW